MKVSHKLVLDWSETFFMKQTGVVRKIDELGRIVLPKEIRRNLGIRDGESLEIFVDEQGVYLQKFSKISDLKEMGKELCNDIKDILKINMILLDRDKVVASFKKELMGTKNTKMLEDLMKERQSYVSKNAQSLLNEQLNGYFMLKPIIVNADCMGMVCFYKEKTFEEWEEKVLDFIVCLFVRKIEI